MLIKVIWYPWFFYCNYANYIVVKQCTSTEGKHILSITVFTRENFPLLLCNNYAGCCLGFSFHQGETILKLQERKNGNRSDILFTASV